MIDNSDKTQKLVGMLATLIDNNFSDVNKKMAEVIAQMEETKKNTANSYEFVNFKLTEHENRIRDIRKTTKCPLSLEERVKTLEGLVDIISLLNKYKWLALIIFFGVCAMLGLGSIKLATLLF